MQGEIDSLKAELSSKQDELKNMNKFVEEH